MSACRAVAGTESHAERLCASGGPNSIGEYFRRVLDRFSSMVGLLHALHNPLVQHLQPGGMVHCASLLALPIKRFKQHGDGASITSLCNFKAENFGHVAASFRFAVPSKVEWAPTTFVPGAHVRLANCRQNVVDVTLAGRNHIGLCRDEGVSMKLVVFGVAMVLAATGAAVAKEKKKVATAQAATSCSAAHMKAGSKQAPKLDCKSTGTVVARPSNRAANFLDHYPRLGFDINPWIPTGY